MGLIRDLGQSSVEEGFDSMLVIATGLSRRVPICGKRGMDLGPLLASDKPQFKGTR